MKLNAAFDMLSRINDRYISLKNDFEAIVSEQGAFSSKIKNKARETEKRIVQAGWKHRVHRIM